MTNPRNLLLMALLMLGYLLWAQWQQDYSPRAPASAAHPAASQAHPAAAGADVPGAVAAGGNAAVTIPTPAAAPAPAAAGGESSGQLITVTTDVLRVQIDTRGGSVVVADLLAYPQQPKDFEHPVRLLDDSTENWFEAQSGLVSAQGNAPTPDHQALFSAPQTDYTLGAGQDRIEVPLTWQDAAGLQVRKLFVFERGSYVIAQSQQLVNHSDRDWVGNAYRQLQRVPLVIEASGIKGYANTERYSFIGAAWYSQADKFQKLPFGDFQKEPLNKTATGGWAAMLQHYFFAAWIPPADQNEQYSTAVVPAGTTTRYLIRAVSPAVSVAPGAEHDFSARLYVGPKLQSTLDEVAPGLSLTVNYGLFTVIAQPLHWLLAKLHGLTGNWGFAIILLVLVIKALFFKLSEAQYRSMARMRKMQPRIAALKERFGDDKQKMNAAMLDLYKKEKINPLGGCLPMLVQIPVFFALYWVLLESVELRQAPFILWIHNLTAPDPYFVLPVLNGAAMLAAQMLTPTAGMDPMQARMMKLMPVVMSVMFAFFPAGLVLYWTTNGVLSLAQQWFITRRIEAGHKT